MSEQTAIPVSPNAYFKQGAVIVIVIALIYAAVSSFYTVESEEQAVVLRFGKYHAITDPGLHFKIPFGVDRAIRVATRRQHKEEFGYRTRSARQGSPTRYDSGGYPEESLMVTGDLNAAQVEWSVQYLIQDPRAFLFNVREPVATMRDASESVMRQVVGDRTVDEVITVGRQEIQYQTLLRLQQLMDEYEMGIKIDQVVLQDVSPPSPVAPSFNAVNEAQQERERMINEARAQYNKAVPRARGQAEQLIQSALGYATERVNRSKGDASRFDSMLVEYLKAPEVTRRRMYLETMQGVLPKLGRKIIVDDEATSVLPLLQIGEGNTEVNR
ncbi:MAG: FtsH protease activity modulator HflK [Opitutales bacterium]|nr:FtsH protease activity modulator HflK [Opitutales bacterium]